MRKLCSFAALLAVMVFCGATAYAQSLNVAYTAAENTGLASASVSLGGGGEICAVQFTVCYDAQRLSLTGASSGSALDGNTAPTINTNEAGAVVFVWDSLVPIKSSGPLLSLQFTQTGASGAETPVWINTADYIIVADAQLNELTMETPPAVMVGAGDSAGQSNQNSPSDGSLQSGSNSGITLNHSDMRLSPGKTAALAVEDYDGALDWTSSNEAVATVDENGVVTAHGSGTAIITAHTADGTAFAICVVTVGSSAPPWLLIAAETAAAGLIVTIVFAVKDFKKKRAAKEAAQQRKRRAAARNKNNAAYKAVQGTEQRGERK